MEAAKIVSEAILGLDFRHVVVAGRAYRVDPPTIRRLAGAARCLSAVAGAATLMEIISSPDNLEALPRALSWFIRGDDTLAASLSEGTPEELKDGLKTAYGLLSTEDFLKLSLLARNVAGTVAKQRQ